MDQQPVGPLPRRVMTTLLFLTVGLAGLLSFVIQPLAGKLVLPRFGGGAEVWTAAMAAFGAANAAGFFAAWLLSLLRQKRWAVGVVSSGWTAVLGYALTADWAELSLVGYLLPFALGIALLIMVAVLLPVWFARTEVPYRTDPYLAYAFSVLGGSAGLVGYPLVLEPLVSFDEQQRYWSLGCLAVALGFLVCSAFIPHAGMSSQEMQEVSGGVHAWLRRIRWTALAALPGLQLLFSSPEVQVVFSAAPLAWLIPLSVFQLTLVIAFARFTSPGHSFLPWAVQAVAALICLPTFLAPLSRWAEGGDRTYAACIAIPFVIALVPHRWTLALQGALSALIVGIVVFQVQVERAGLLLLHLALLAATCWGCHGEMLADKPSARRFVEFLFFTGIGASVTVQIVGWLLASLPGVAVIPSIAVLALLMRIAPQRGGAEPRTGAAPLD